jgi:hypothetical protein
MVSVRPFGDNAGGQTGVKMKQVFTPVHETTWLWRKLHPKFSCFSVRVQTCCAGLPPRLTVKEIPGEPGFQSAASDGHRHTPHDHNLNYTIWTLYAESVGFPVNVTLLWGTPTPIYQATWVAPTQIKLLGTRAVKSIKQLGVRPLQSVKQLGVRPLQSIKHLGARPSSNLGRAHLPTNQAICPELRVNIRIANSQQ